MSDQSVFDQSVWLYSQLSKTYTLTAAGEKIVFPPDGDATGSSQVPGVTNLEKPAQTLTVVESNKPIKGAASPPGCSATAKLYWYSTLKINGTTGANTTFKSAKVPITFASKTLITAGHKYGLCVNALGIVVQDDAAGKPGPLVSPTGTTVKLTLVIPSFLHNAFPNNTLASVFFEKK